MAPTWAGPGLLVFYLVFKYIIHVENICYLLRHIRREVLF